jgi:hypothetical protein
LRFFGAAAALRFFALFAIFASFQIVAPLLQRVVGRES